ncbi:MAG: ribosomal protein S18-alanine N-acetyltransferase [Vampirovibrionales bacterium]|nr:ribosomal protein S18-alanine N-acetyltransferase [Vampirovibrionales bacterium]
MSPITPSQLEIRRMRAADVGGVMAIESVSFGTHHWSEDSFLAELNNPMGRYFTLALRSPERGGPSEQPYGHVAGYGGYWLILDEAHITTLAVHPEYRGHSLGEALLLQLLDCCLGQTVHWVTLEVRVSNEAAQNLYYKYGFEVSGRRRRYYQDNEEDALIMTTPDIATEAFRTLFRTRKAAYVKTFAGLPQGVSV